jgi:signal transduction histidine kinase
VFAISVVGLMGFVAWSATGYMARQIDNTVANELAEVQSDAADGSDAALRPVVEALIVHSPGVFYLLQDAKGRLIAGNMQPIDPRPGRRVLVSAPQTQPGHALGGIRGRGVVLSSGSYLFVGLSPFELGEMQEVIGRAAAWGLAATALIALAGGLTTSLWLLRRIDAISLASREIMAGDLGRRIVLHGNGDEFDRLAAGLNAMLDRIQELMRGLQQVSSDIAHDLRTPLTRLRQRLELARRRSGSVAEYQAAIDAAIGDSQAMLDLFAALLRIAQIESGTRRAGFTQVDLSVVLADLAEAYGPELEAGGQSLTTRIEPALCLHGDRQLLAQLFANLIENALRHCPGGTHVHLDARADPTGIRVSVSDDGPGVPQEFRQELLRPFSRLERSRTTPGSGLGLSLASAIAVLHDARLVLEDAEPGLRCVLAFRTGTRA